MSQDLRAFPVVYVADVRLSARFYERFGFTVRYSHPNDLDPGYIKLARGVDELAVVDQRSPADLLGAGKGAGYRFEMYVFVDDVDLTIASLPDDTVILRQPQDMSWGERIAYVSDPDGNPVVLATRVDS